MIHIFLLFDTVHIVKNVRGNWLNEKMLTFCFPSMANDDKLQVAKFQDLRDIYEKEKLLNVKLAPKLSYKALYPSSLERQNVKLALNIFDEKNLEAIKQFEPILGSQCLGT